VGRDQKEYAALEWRDGHVPVSTRFADPYYSMQNGLAEARHVFLAGNGLPARFRDGFQIAELGFGTGLNLLAVWHEWRPSNQAGTLRFTSFEAFPMSPDDMETALKAFPELAPLAQELLAARRQGADQFQLDEVEVEVVQGDARETLPLWDGRADAWFLDGFSPARNAELWQPSLMAQVACHTRQGGTFATYTAAGHIRKSLSEVGFKVDRVPGYGRKRHMTIGILEKRT